MANNEELEKVNNSPNVVNQTTKAARTYTKKAINKAVSNAVRAWILPILPWIIGIALILVIVAGIIMFFISGIGLAFEPIKTAADNYGHKVKAWWYGGEQYLVTDQEIIDVANSIEAGGYYDLLGDGFLTGVLKEGEDQKVSKGLERNYSLEDISIDSSGIARDEKGITNIKSDLIRQYLVSSNYMYTMYNDNSSRFGKSGFIKIYEDGGVVGQKAKLYPVNNPILDAVTANILSVVFSFADGESNMQINVNTKDKTLEIANVKGIFWWKKINKFKYSLEGWTGRYGMPLEFLMSVHLASMQPDLAYEMTTEFPTNVNLLLHPVTSTIVPHIILDGINYTEIPDKDVWASMCNIKYDENGKPIEYDENGNKIKPNEHDNHNREQLVADFAKVRDSFFMYYPYIGDVTDHWFRNVYLTIGGDDSVELIKNDQKFEDYTGERWTDYETAVDKDGNTYYVLYEINADGSLGKVYNGTVEQASEEGVQVSKKAKTKTIQGYWSAYDIENNGILISDSALTPDVVGGEDVFNSIYYRDEITYEATTSELLRQARDGERGVTNSKIKKMLTQYSYYTYNGQPDRALAIQKDKEQFEDYYKDYKHEDENGKLIDGTDKDKRDQNLVGKFSINAEALSAFKILENMNTLDADEIYRDFKELIVELNYFEKENFAGNATDVFLWPIPECGTAGWPVREFEKIENVFGTLINSRTNLLNLKNLFLQYRETDEAESGVQESLPSNTIEEQPILSELDSDGAIKDKNGNPIVDESGFITEAGEKQLEEDDEEWDITVQNDTVKEEKPNTQNNEEGTQGESEGRRAGGAVDESKITQDFIKAEDESGAQGWYDTYDIVVDNMDLDDENCGYIQGSKNSYLNFLYGLGGVFSEYAGEENNGDGTYEDFIAGCQYVYGLCTMFGFDYCDTEGPRCDVYQHGFYGGSRIGNGGVNYATIRDATNDAYYCSTRYSGDIHSDWWSDGGHCDGARGRLLDRSMVYGRYGTNCNFTTDKVYYKAGLFDATDMSCAWGALLAKYGGNYVYRIEDLQVGDLIQHYDGGVWKHVSFVGEINDDEIVVYETGHGWISTGDFRFVYNRYTDSKPTGHDTWFGVHIFDLQPKNRDEYEGYEGNVEVVSPITGEVIDAGQITVTNGQTNEVETVGFIKIRALVAGDIGTSIPDTDISNLDEKPYLKVHKLKEGSEEERLEYDYGGYKLFLQEYQNAKVTGYVLYMEGFDLRLFEKDSSGKVRLNTSESESAKSVLNKDGKPRDRYVSETYREVIGKETRNILKNKQKLRKVAVPLIQTDSGRIFIKEGTVLGRTYTDNGYEERRIRDEKTAVVRPCLEKRIKNNSKPDLTLLTSTKALSMGGTNLDDLEPNEYPTGNYIKLILRTAEDGGATTEANSTIVNKDNIIEDCEDYIDIDEIEETSGITKVLCMGDSQMYCNDLAGQLAALARKSSRMMISVCAYNDGATLDYINDNNELKTACWITRNGKLQLTKGKGTIGDIKGKDYGDIDRKGKWDYIIVPGDSVESVKEAYESMKRSLTDSKTFIIWCRDGNVNKFNELAKELKCSVIDAKTVWEEFKEQNLLTLADGNPSGVKQYMSACILHAKIYGKSDLSVFLPLYNKKNGHTSEFYKIAEYNDGGDENKCNVDEEKARQIQEAVVKHYEDGVLAIN